RLPSCFDFFEIFPICLAAAKPSSRQLGFPTPAPATSPVERLNWEQIGNKFGNKLGTEHHRPPWKTARQGPAKSMRGKDGRYFCRLITQRYRVQIPPPQPTFSTA